MIPSGPFASGFDAPFVMGFAPEKIYSDMAKHGKGLRAFLFAEPAGILLKRDIEYPRKRNKKVAVSVVIVDGNQSCEIGPHLSTDYVVVHTGIE